MRWLIPLLLICSVCYAGEKELNRGREIAQAKGITLTAEDESNLLNRGWRDRRKDEKPPVTALSKPPDFVNEYHRGTVEKITGWRNYSFHKIKIPSGTLLENMNFTQIVPDTDAFDRTPGYFGHNLTFRNCNLVNVRTYPDWTIEDCNISQIDYYEEDVLDEEENVIGTDRKGQWHSKGSANVNPDRVKPERVIE